MKLKKSDLTTVSAFVGELKHRMTGKTKYCDLCQKEPAVWLHQTTRGTTVYLCFGCGDH